MIFAEKPSLMEVTGAGNRQGGGGGAPTGDPPPPSQTAPGAGEQPETEMTTQDPTESAQQREEEEPRSAATEKSSLLRPMGWPGDMETTTGQYLTGAPTGRIVAGPPGDCPEGQGLGLDNDNEQRVVLNVGGVRHETRLSTLKAIPNTRLSRLAHTHTQFIQPSTPSPLLTTPTLSAGVSPLATLLPPTEYFFDRHPAVFNAVIDFYRTGDKSSRMVGTSS